MMVGAMLKPSEGVVVGPTDGVVVGAEPCPNTAPTTAPSVDSSTTTPPVGNVNDKAILIVSLLSS